MLKRRLYCVLILSAAMPLFIHCLKTPQKYYRVTSLWTENRDDIAPADFNGDGVDELMRKTSVQLDVISQVEKKYIHSFRMNQSDGFSAYPLAGATLDSVSFIVSTNTKDTSFVDFLAHVQTGQEARYSWNLYKFPRVNGPNQNTHDQGMRVVGRFTSQGRRLTLFCLSTPYDTHFDRGVVAYDLTQNKEVWRFLCGPQIVSWQFEDIDNDSSEEIILGSYAPSNQFLKNGTCDDSSYVFVLDNNGSLIWKKALGGSFTGAHSFVGDFGKKGKRICTFKNDFSQNGEQNQVELRHPLDGTVTDGPIRMGKRITFPPILSSPWCDDLDGDGKDEIVFGNVDGYVRAIDENLQLLHISERYRKNIMVEFPADLNGDGLKEIVCQLPNEKIVILDFALRELAAFPLELQLGHQIFPVKAEGFYRILLKSTSVYKTTESINTWRLLELEQSLIPFETYTGAAKYFWWTLGGLSFLAFLGIAYRTRKKAMTKLYIRLLMRNRSFDHSLLIDINGKIAAAGRHWEDLSVQPALPMIGAFLSRDKILPSTIQAALLKNLERKDKTIPKFVIEKNGQGHPVAVDIEFIKVLSIYRVLLRFLNEENLIKNIKHWSGVAQKLAHSIKNPLTAIKLNSEELEYRLKQVGCQDTDVHEYLLSISAQIDKLRRMADGFMRFVEFEELNLSQTDINQFIEEIIAQQRDNIPQHIVVSLELDRVLPYVFIDQAQFKFAFENVFCNALQSFADHGTVHLSTHFVQLFDAQAATALNYVELRFQDNGAGIPADVLHRVTLPYYTTKKEGTGLGLSIVVKIIEMHEGQFEISSREGEGTTVTLRLKAAG